MYDGHVVYTCPSLWPIVASSPAWDGTGCELDSWQCRRYITCTLSLRLLGSFRGFLDTYGLTQKLCLKNIYTQHIWVFICIFFLLKSEVGADEEGPPILILPRAAKCLRPGLFVPLSQ